MFQNFTSKRTFFLHLISPQTLLLHDQFLNFFRGQFFNLSMAYLQIVLITLIKFGPLFGFFLAHHIGFNPMCLDFLDYYAQLEHTMNSSIVFFDPRYFSFLKKNSFLKIHQMHNPLCCRQFLTLQLRFEKKSS